MNVRIREWPDSQASQSWRGLHRSKSLGLRQFRGCLMAWMISGNDEAPCSSGSERSPNDGPVKRQKSAVTAPSLILTATFDEFQDYRVTGRASVVRWACLTVVELGMSQKHSSVSGCSKTLTTQRLSKGSDAARIFKLGAALESSGSQITYYCEPSTCCR